MNIEGRDVAIGLVAGSALLFTIEIWPQLSKPEEREVKHYHPPRDQNDFEALVTSWIVFGSLGFVANLWADLIFGPKSWKEVLSE